MVVGVGGRIAQRLFALAAGSLDGASLTPDAERALAPLGRALSSRDLAAFRFRIEGHTDNVGDPGTNQALSERRANAVKDYLVAGGIPAEKITASGAGESQAKMTELEKAVDQWMPYVTKPTCNECPMKPNQAMCIQS